MSDNKTIAIMMSSFIIFGFSAMGISNYVEGNVNKEKEKTEQLKIQWKIDSVKTINSNINSINK